MAGIFPTPSSSAPQPSLPYGRERLHLPEAGVVRITIDTPTYGAGARRFNLQALHTEKANRLYHHIFATLGMPLLDGTDTVAVQSNTIGGLLDSQLGIDVVLTFRNMMCSTLQEKFLITRHRTVTVEYMQDPRSQEWGDWHWLACQYYFVGYERYGGDSFQDWALFDWPKLVRATQHKKIPWQHYQNHRDNARASLMSVKFRHIPMDCYVAMSTSVGAYCRGEDSRDYITES